MVPYIFGKVYGPYTRPDRIKFVIIIIHNEYGVIINRMTLTYRKYMEEYDKGMHRYEEYIKPIKEVKVVNENKEYTVNCLFCKKEFISRKNKDIYFCSRICREKGKRKLKRKQVFIQYHNQFVIKITRVNNEEWFIIFDKNRIEKRSIFINKNKCKLIITDDNNGLIRYKLDYDVNDGIEIKPAKGFKKLFWITKDGNVISRRTKKELVKVKNKKGYLTIPSRIGGKDGKDICPRVHRLVAKTFIINPLNKPEVNHKNGIKEDNAVENLEWVTPRENMLHAINTRLIIPRCGCNASGSKFTKEQIKSIRVNNSMSMRDIAKEYNVSHSTISDIRNGKTYKNI